MHTVAAAEAVVVVVVAAADGKGEGGVLGLSPTHRRTHIVCRPEVRAVVVSAAAVVVRR